MDFDAILPKLDEATNARLGNSVEISTNDGADFTTIKGTLFVGTEGQNEEFTEVDPIGNVSRFKVRKALIAVPTTDHIVRHPTLDGDHRFENWITVEGGRWWLIDLQKA